MTWVESSSETFTARHDARDGADAERVLAQLEHARRTLERRFSARLGDLAVVLHGSTAQLDAAQPWLPVQRALTAPAGPALPRRLDRPRHAARPVPAGAGPAGVQRGGLAGDADARAIGAARPPDGRRQPPRLPPALQPAALPALPEPAVADRGRRAVLLGADAPPAPGRGRPPPRRPAAELPARAPRRRAAGRHGLRPAGAGGGRGRVRPPGERPVAGRRGAGARSAPFPGRAIRHTEAAWRSHLARLAAGAPEISARPVREARPRA